MPVELVSLPEPWTPAQATDRIRAKALSDGFALAWTYHAKEQMEERYLLAGDVLHVLKKGFVYDDAVPSTRPPMCRYKMVSFTPNSERREVAIIVIPSYSSDEAKIVSVMWVDETTRSGR